MVSFKERVLSWQIRELCYGIHDAGELTKPMEDKFIFALVGSIQPRKGQDLLLDAFEELPEEYKKLCEIWLVGPATDTEYARAIRDRVEKMDSVKMLGAFANEELQKIYRDISVLVCPSLEDTMPIVCAEAMMHYKPCIVSSTVGTGMYIDDKENGLIFTSGDAVDLKNQMKWIIDNKSIIKDMGKRARGVYERKFSYDVFKENIFGMVKERLRD